ncbi:hypothetical protein DS62_11810, partial [Smithella sp. SC_K08D17]
ADENLTQLSNRLISNTYEPSEILRFYIPKHSGLHRPITFLHLDDLIVYQAIANIIADKFWEKRSEVQGITTYSNIFNDEGKNSIFIFKKWQYGYRGFINKIKNLYKKDNNWVASFDLAAYYDTIDLKLLAEKISSKAYKDFTGFLIKCISAWTTHRTKKLHHGIPQGPISSSLIGEIYLLSLDQKLKSRGIKYVRYVDDIKIFGKTKEEVQQGIILLEHECKERGLIPQAKKYEIVNTKNVEEAIGKFPSLQSDEKRVIIKNEKEACHLFTNAFVPSDPAAFDVSKVRYILKTSPKNEGILKIVLENIEKHPELTDEFCKFLSNYRDSEDIATKIYNATIKKRIVYSYAEGKYWQLLAEFKIENTTTKKRYLRDAIRKLINNRDSFSLKLGLYKFIGLNDNHLILKFLPYETSCLIQMMVFPYVPVVSYGSEEFKILLGKLFSRSNYDAPLTAIKEILFSDKGYLLEDPNLISKDETGVIANTLGHSYNFDAIDVILNKTYTVKFKKWKIFLNRNYNQANSLIQYARAAFHIEINAWINYTDAFLDIVIREFILLLKDNGFSRLPNTTDSHGLVDLGVLLHDKNLRTFFPGMIDGFQKLHKRRRTTPTSHAFDKKTFAKTKSLTREEQKNYVSTFNNSLNQLLAEADKYLK